MKKYSEINTLNDTDFQRTVGLPKDRFNALLLKMAHHGFQGLDKNTLNLEDCEHQSHWLKNCHEAKYPQFDR